MRAKGATAQPEIGTISPEASLEPTARAFQQRGQGTTTQQLKEGPHNAVHVFWLAGMSCDGCTVSVSGATNPSLEDLLNGQISGLPKVILHHYVLSTEAGEEYIENYRMAWRGELDAPYITVYEGSIANEEIAGRTGGCWASMGVEETPEGPQPISTAEWQRRLAPGAAAAIAIGTCATWGGIPASAGNPTGAMSLMDFLGKDYRSAYGLPVINVPGCAPQGDNFTETVATLLYFLQGIGPLPEFDALGRPAWLFGETVHRGCTRAGWYEEGSFADHFGGKECLVEIGCWGPVVNCNIVKRGAINHMGGCMEAGGACIGCTMPGFPDKFSPFYKRPPGSAVSTTGAKLYGGLIRRMRKLTQDSHNREKHWDVAKEVPSAWSEVNEPGMLKKLENRAYEALQFWRGKRPGRKGKKVEFGCTRPGRDDDYPSG
jgi:hydrogenase small subunit